jgi:hypothetical protein
MARMDHAAPRAMRATIPRVIQVLICNRVRIFMGAFPERAAFGKKWMNDSNDICFSKDLQGENR